MKNSLSFVVGTVMVIMVFYAVGIVVAMLPIRNDGGSDSTSEFLTIVAIVATLTVALQVMATVAMKEFVKLVRGRKYSELDQDLKFELKKVDRMPFLIAVVPTLIVLLAYWAYRPSVKVDPGSSVLVELFRKGYFEFDFGMLVVLLAMLAHSVASLMMLPKSANRTIRALVREMRNELGVPGSRNCERSAIVTEVYDSIRRRYVNTLGRGFKWVAQTVVEIMWPTLLLFLIAFVEGVVLIVGWQLPFIFSTSVFLNDIHWRALGGLAASVMLCIVIYLSFYEIGLKYASLRAFDSWSVAAALRSSVVVNIPSVLNAVAGALSLAALVVSLANRFYGGSGSISFLFLVVAAVVLMAALSMMLGVYVSAREVERVKFFWDRERDPLGVDRREVRVIASTESFWRTFSTNGELMHWVPHSLE